MPAFMPCGVRRVSHLRDAPEEIHGLAVDERGR